MTSPLLASLPATFGVNEFERRLYAVITAYKQQLGVQCVAQGRFGTQSEGLGDGTTNLLANGRPDLYLLSHSCPT